MTGHYRHLTDFTDTPNEAGVPNVRYFRSLDSRSRAGYKRRLTQQRKGMCERTEMTTARHRAASHSNPPTGIPRALPDREEHALDTTEGRP
ncbi:hypothetical protein TNCT6_44170 [Streptomyces sp. 6-11-2]|nr:hypothetical protein TNCT6_44170 [Streptomyces sp. 6-11-2]